VVTFDSLLMHFAEQMKAKVIVLACARVRLRLRFQMTGMNAASARTSKPCS
jgi:hypothetical protein